MESADPCPNDEGFWQMSQACCGSGDWTLRLNASTISLLPLKLASVHAVKPLAQPESQEGEALLFKFHHQQPWLTSSNVEEKDVRNAVQALMEQVDSTTAQKG